MSIIELVGVYGPLGAAVVAAVVWVANVYINKIRPEQVAHEERSLNDHRQLVLQIASVVEKNTAAMLELRATLDKREDMDRVRSEAQTLAMIAIKDQLRNLGEDVSALFARADMPRPSRARRE